MSNGYTEDHLVEQPAMQLMQHELGWEVGGNIEHRTPNIELELWQRPAARRHSHFWLNVGFNFRLVGFLYPVYLDSMKTTIDIPDAALADAMRFTGAKTKREAVVKALESYNRQQRVQDLVASFGTLDFASNDEIEAGDLAEIALKEAGARRS